MFGAELRPEPGPCWINGPCRPGWCCSGTVPPNGHKVVNTRDARTFPSSRKAGARPRPSGRSWAPTASQSSPRSSPAPSSRASETCALAGFEGEIDPDLLEWDYGAYEGITTAEIQQSRPGWNLWSDGVPEGETAAEVGRRADRVVERAKSVAGDTLVVAHGHFLRVLAARWLGLPPAAGRLFMLDAGAICVLAAEHDLPAVRLWNLVAPPAD